MKKSVDEIMKWQNVIPKQYRSYVDPGFKKAISKINMAKKTEGNTEAANYIDGLIK